MTFIPTIKIVNGQTYYKMVNPDLKYEYYISENSSIIYDKQLKAGIKACEIKPYFNTGTGYYTFNLTKTTTGILVNYHRALYEAVYGPVGDLFIDHINSDKLENSLDNLQAITSAANTRKGANAKIDSTTALAIYQAYKTASDKTMAEVATQFGVMRSTVKNIVSGHAWADITGISKYAFTSSKEVYQKRNQKQLAKNKAIKLAKGL